MIIVLVIALIVVGVGAFVLFFNKKAVPAPIVQTPAEDVIAVVRPEEIGLSLTASADSKKIIFEIANTKDISNIDYELSYMSKGDIPRGAIGNISIKQAGQSVKQEIPLGTCSDVCHYDQEVSDIRLILKVVKTDGSTSQTEKTLEL